MSLINQVLKDLDKRGASTNIGEATLRVVHTGKQRSAFWLVAAGAAGMLVVAAAAWMVWNAQMKPAAPAVVAVVPAKIVETLPVEILPASQPAAAATAEVPAELTAPAPRPSNKPNTAPQADTLAVKPLLPLEPVISAVSPNPVISLGLPQPVTITGSNFSPDATVTLRSRGRVYTRRQIVMQNSEKIVIRTSFGNLAGPRSVEVVNGSGNASGQFTSGQFTFMVETSPADAIVQAQNKAALSAAKSKQGAAKPVTAVIPTSGVSKQPTQITPQQQADNEFRRAYQLMRQGRNTEALAGYEAALLLDAGHELARQSMVSLLLEKKRNADAERVLQEGLINNPQQASFAMLLARLQVERNVLPLALDTLMHTLPYAEKQPDYLAFVAALLQRQNSHKEAIDYYQKALRLKPQSGVWLMGMGISLRAEQRNADARDAFKRALDSNTLNAELQSFVNQQLKEL